jgi:hypothetical protein
LLKVNIKFILGAFFFLTIVTFGVYDLVAVIFLNEKKRRINPYVWSKSNNIEFYMQKVISLDR